MAVTADTKDRRYAEFAVAEGIATEAQVEECLAIRAKLVKAGAQAKTLPEILLAKGYISKEAAKQLAALAPAGGAAAAAKGAGGPATKDAAARGERAPGAEPRPPEIPGFEVLELLGKGGMGAVYKARQLSLDRIVALKVLSPEAARDETYVRRFTTEARALARLNHENIIAGIDVGEAGGIRYFAMEYVEGEPLSATIEREGALPEKRVLKIAMQIARALAHAEKNGLVHRDVKPQNIMLGRNDVAKLCDLGLAMTAEERKEARDRGQSIGTPHYISPEQARGEHKVDIRSDIYSLGASLYHAATGETPFTGTSPMVLMTKHLTEEPIAPKKRRPGVSKALNDLIVKMMAKEKEKRYQSPLELLEDMERVLAGRTTQAAAPPAKAAATPRAGGGVVAAKRTAPATRRPTPRPEGEDGAPAALSADPRRWPKAAQPASMTPAIVTACVLVFGGLGAALVWKGVQDRDARQEEPAPSDEDEDAALKSLENVTRVYNAGQCDKYEAMENLRKIARLYPRTKAGIKAAEEAKRVEAAPVKRTDGADDDEATPSKKSDNPLD
jgi:serine/threonine-protein kinase